MLVSATREVVVSVAVVGVIFFALSLLDIVFIDLVILNLEYSQSVKLEEMAHLDEDFSHFESVLGGRAIENLIVVH